MRAVQLLHVALNQSREDARPLTPVVAPRVKGGKTGRHGPIYGLGTVPVTRGSGATGQSFSSSPPWEYETNTGKTCAVTVHPRLPGHAFQGGICYGRLRRRPQVSGRRPTDRRLLALLSASLPRRKSARRASGCPAWRGCLEPPQFLWISAVAGCPDCRCCQIGRGSEGTDSQPQRSTKRQPRPRCLSLTGSDPRRHEGPRPTRSGASKGRKQRHAAPHRRCCGNDTKREYWRACDEGLHNWTGREDL